MILHFLIYEVEISNNKSWLLVDANNGSKYGGLSFMYSHRVETVGSDQKEQGVQGPFPDPESLAGVQQHGAK